MNSTLLPTTHNPHIVIESSQYQVERLQVVGNAKYLIDNKSRASGGVEFRSLFKAYVASPITNLFVCCIVPVVKSLYTTDTLFLRQKLISHSAFPNLKFRLLVDQRSRREQALHTSPPSRASRVSAGIHGEAKANDHESARLTSCFTKVYRITGH